ncbi:MAG TPA: hypothetical protein VEG44_00020 [Candidatus Acidoferrales bacterium]|nr:hypothetical protein [Candidatus Acidoferrales bacterium]
MDLSSVELLYIALWDLKTQLEQVYLSSGHAPWVLSNSVSSMIIQMATGLREYLIKAGAITVS